MRRSRLIDILENFSKTEWKNCDRYIKAMTKEGGDINKFWGFIYTNKNALPKQLNNTSAISEATGLKPSYSYIKKTNNKLLVLIDEFLIIQDMRSSKITYDLKKINLYYNRQLYHHGDFLTKKVIREVESKNSYDLFDRQSLLQFHLYRYFSEHPNKYIQGPEILKDIKDNLEISTAQLANFLRAEMKNRSLLLKEDYSQDLESLYSLSQRAQDDPLVHILSRTHDLLSTGSSNSLNFLLTTIETQPSKIEAQLKKALIVLISNFLTMEIKNGRHINHLSELLKIYKMGIATGSLLDDGQIPLTRMVNIIELAGVNKQSSWAFKFTEKYINLVTSSKKENIGPYIQSNLHFYKKEYSKAFAILKDIKIDEPVEELRRRELLIISSYEIHAHSATELLLSQVNNYEQWIWAHRNELSETNQMGSRNLIRFIRMKMKNSSKKKLKDYLNNVSPFRKRSWALQQL